MIMEKKEEMHIPKSKAATIAIAVFLILLLAASLSLNVLGQVYFPVGTPVPTYVFINVAPNPAGIGQAVTVNFFLSAPLESGERPINMTVVQTDPDGITTTIVANATGDTT